MRRCILFVLLLLACNLSRPATPTPILPPTLTPIPEPTQPTASDGWTLVAPGLERRLYSPEDQFFGQIEVLRIDPTLYTFKAHYGQPLTTGQWRQTLPEAAAFVNANFFQANGQVLGLLVSDGQVNGSSYNDRGGMLAIQDGQVRVRSNITEPYLGEPLEQAVQGFPMLVENGEAAYNSNNPDQMTRRTAVGQDGQGRIILMATPLLGMTLNDFSAFLAESDLGLMTAFNLDGGGSTMMVYDNFMLPSIDPVPAVLAVYAK